LLSALYLNVETPVLRSTNPPAFFQTCTGTGKNTGNFREKFENLRISRQFRKNAENNSGITAGGNGLNSGITAEFTRDPSHDRGLARNQALD
jgi:hypothetical protein